MKAKMNSVTISYHYAHTNKYAKTKLVDDSEINSGILKFLEAENDAQSMKIKFSSVDIDWISKNLSNTNTKIEVDIYCGIAVIYNQPNYTPVMRQLSDYPIMYEPAKGYYIKDKLEHSESSLPGVWITSRGHHVISSPQIAPIFSGYIQGDFTGNLANLFSPLCTIFHNKLAYVENYQQGKLKIQTSIYDKAGYTMQLSPVLINEIINNVEKSSSNFLTNSQESIEQRVLRLKNEVTKLTNQLLEVSKELHEFVDILPSNDNNVIDATVLGNIVTPEFPS